MGGKPKITVLNITARYGGLDILKGDLDRQAFKDFELVIVDGLWKERENDVKKYFHDYPLTYVRQSSKREGAYSNLAHADNEGFKVCKGDLIVCLQDYIWISPIGLLKFWEGYKAGGDILISGVGDQYTPPEVTNPKGLVSVFEKDYTETPAKKCWFDPRKRMDQGTFYETAPVNWELNYCAIPRKVIYELGGMDEEYDFHGFAYDNVNIAQRAEFLGYKTYLDQTNDCRAIEHDSWYISENKKERSTDIAQFHIQRMKDTIAGRFPLKLEFL